MADIIYTYKHQVYVNITNKCDCSCRFCIRSHQDRVGEAENLWFQAEPTLEEIKNAMDTFDFSGYDEVVYCGYGEPTCALEHLIASAKYLKEKYPVKVRLNTNGLANLYHNRNIIPDLAKVINRVSISLNAPTAEEYQEITRPQFENAFPAMLEFASMAKDSFELVQFSIVDVLSKEAQEASQMLADSIGIPLRIRKFS